jgi:hypothetical protein
MLAGSIDENCENVAVQVSRDAFMHVEPLHYLGDASRLRLDGW